MQRWFTDMTGRRVAINGLPKRIVSLVPSQTELLHDLGLNDEVVGITKFCIHPDEWFRNKARVGGTKTVHIDHVQALNPDLIIANKEENTREQVEALAALYPVWISDIKTIEQGMQMIAEVGDMLGRTEQASLINRTILAGFNTLVANRPFRVAYFIWRNPWMCAGGDTFISDMIVKMGWVNVLADVPRYPEVQLTDLQSQDVDVVLLSSEPYPFKDAHIAEIQAALPGAEVKLVDGEMFSWYGSRMRHAATYLQSLL